MKKYNDKNKKFSDWTTKKLKSEAKIYYDLCYGEMPCYGVRDIIHLDGILLELRGRGIEPKNNLTF